MMRAMSRVYTISHIQSSKGLLVGINIQLIELVMNSRIQPAILLDNIGMLHVTLSLAKRPGDFYWKLES